MIVDFSSLTRQVPRDFDICVVGAGPAGISFAREFIGAPVRVCVLESGLLATDSSIQDLSRGSVEGSNFDTDALSGGRLRQFAGTSNMWCYRAAPDDGRRYARSLPPEAVDFESHEGRPELGWPMSFESLAPFYRRAQSLWNGAPFDYETSTWCDDDARPLSISSGRLVTRMCQHGPADVFALNYRDDLIGADNVSLCLGCTAVQIESNGTKSVTGVRIARADGSAMSIAAKVIILATGGIENVQLLLLSEITKPGAAGNLHDNVGRYLSDHPEFRAGIFTPARRDVFDAIALYDIRTVRQFPVSGLLTITQDLKRSEKLLNVSAVLVAQEAGFGTRAHKALWSLGAIRRQKSATDALGALGALVTSPGDALAFAQLRMRHRVNHDFQGGWSRREAERHRFRAIEVWVAPEQTTDRNNFVTLGSERDGLGRCRPRLTWRWSAADRENVVRTLAIMSADLAPAGFGPFTPWVKSGGFDRLHFQGLHHPMGGTRMHDDPRFGVVDADCRIHGLDNLYVAGSSVFSSGHGYANPTLTLLALTLRLADHVKHRLGVFKTARTLVEGFVHGA